MLVTVIEYKVKIFIFTLKISKKKIYSLDFEQFTLNGPADSIETDGGKCNDLFTVTVSNTLFGKLKKKTRENFQTYLYIFFRLVQLLRQRPIQ